MLPYLCVQTKLFDLAKATNLQEKIAAMKAAKHLNMTEDRAVLHIALRAPASDVRSLPSVVINTVT